VDFEELRYYGVERIHLTQDKAQQWTLSKTEIYLQGQYVAYNFLAK
jgi:phage terminase Nu1 subunit (DNA packaging protein)